MNGKIRGWSIGEYVGDVPPRVAELTVSIPAGDLPEVLPGGDVLILTGDEAKAVRSVVAELRGQAAGNLRRLGMLRGVL